MTGPQQQGAEGCANAEQAWKSLAEALTALEPFVRCGFLEEDVQGLFGDRVAWSDESETWVAR